MALSIITEVLAVLTLNNWLSRVNLELIGQAPKLFRAYLERLQLLIICHIRQPYLVTQCRILNIDYVLHIHWSYSERRLKVYHFSQISWKFKLLDVDHYGNFNGLISFCPSLQPYVLENSDLICWNCDVSTDAIYSDICVIMIIYYRITCLFVCCHFHVNHRIDFYGAESTCGIQELDIVTSMESLNQVFS